MDRLFVIRDAAIIEQINHTGAEHFRVDPQIFVIGQWSQNGVRNIPNTC